MLRSCSLALLALLLMACQQASDTNLRDTDMHEAASATEAETGLAKASVARAKVDDDVILAWVDQQPITQQALDATIALELFDYAWAVYELRTKALAGVIQAKVEASDAPAHTIDIKLEPPMPPRLSVPKDAATFIGDADAPIRLSVYCSYESSHCLRMQNAYAELSQDYGDMLRFEFQDFYLPFHRHALTAAIAARCAQQQGYFEPYHKALWARQDSLSDSLLYGRIATQLSMDTARFEACLKDGPIRESIENSIEKSVEDARQRGFSNVPVTLINGLYLRGPKTASVMAYYVDRELARLGVSQEDEAAPQSKATPDARLEETALPLRLQGLAGTSDQASASALIANLDSGESQQYYVQDAVMEEVLLVQIGAGFVVLDNRGALERLSLSSDQNSSAPQSGAQEGVDMGEEMSLTADSEGDVPEQRAPVIAEGKVSHGDEEIPEDLEYQYRGIVAPKGETPLSREWLDNQLMHELSLAEHFKAAEHEMADGEQLMRLEGIQGNAFYQTLGFQEGDVVMRVNNKWVHSQQNDFFVDLQRESEISVVLMRKGLPVHYHFVVN